MRDGIKACWVVLKICCQGNPARRSQGFPWAAGTLWAGLSIQINSVQIFEGVFLNLLKCFGREGWSLPSSENKKNWQYQISPWCKSVGLYVVIGICAAPGPAIGVEI